MCRRASIRRRCHRGTVSLPFYRWSLTAGRPVSGYPENLNSLGDHVCKARLDRGLNRKAVATELRIDPVSLKNWEEHRTEIEIRFYPRIIGWLGYDPLPGPETQGQYVLAERLRRGWSRKRLAREAGIDEATMRRIETDTPRLARRPVEAVYQALGLESRQEDTEGTAAGNSSSIGRGPSARINSAIELPPTTRTKIDRRSQGERSPASLLLSATNVKD